MATPVTGLLFAEWAGRNVGRWRRLIHQCVIHRVLGPGEVVAVRQDGEGTVLEVRYSPDDVRQYVRAYFDVTFRVLELEKSLAVEVSEKQAPVRALRLEDLRAAIESGRVLEPQELHWLGAGEHIEELESYLAKHGARWPAATVGAYWRTCGYPDRNLMVTAAVEQSAARVASESAVWTTRGAAYADLEQMGDAERCAANAIECRRESFHPHNLLGRIHRYLGDDEQADRDFVEAKRLGASEGIRRSADLQGQHGTPVKTRTDRKEQATHSATEVPF